MSKYLIHYFMNGLPVGVWDEKGNHFYKEENARAQRYGESVLGDASFDDWEALLELWDGKTPNGTARWGSLETERTSLEDVLTEAIDRSER